MLEIHQKIHQCQKTLGINQQEPERRKAQKPNRQHLHQTRTAAHLTRLQLHLPQLDVGRGGKTDARYRSAAVGASGSRINGAKPPERSSSTPHSAPPTVPGPKIQSQEGRSARRGRPKNDRRVSDHTQGVRLVHSISTPPPSRSPSSSARTGLLQATSRPKGQAERYGGEVARRRVRADGETGTNAGELERSGRARAKVPGPTAFNTAPLASGEGGEGKWRKTQQTPPGCMQNATQIRKPIKFLLLSRRLKQCKGGTFPSIRCRGRKMFRIDVCMGMIQLPLSEDV